MSSDRAAQLIFEAHKGQAQFAYFQLGVSASAIAFAIHETSGVSLSGAPWPLGLAVALWAISFAVGCFGLEARQGGLNSNAAYLLALNETPREMMNHPPIAKAIEEMKAGVEKNVWRPGLWFRWQKWALFAGALAYIAGHIMQMAATPAQTHGNKEETQRWISNRSIPEQIFRQSTLTGTT